jgi:8-oxo-dGTP pyrophosphatase MutT (NUDIX family)
MVDKDLYFVAVKVFLREGEKMLITHDIFGAWDLPGGRIRPDEFDKPMEEVIHRKLHEELGVEVRYDLGEPVGVFFRVERIENSTGVGLWISKTLSLSMADSEKAQPVFSRILEPYGYCSRLG